MNILIPVTAIIINLVILFYVVRKATRADEQVNLLRQILATQKSETKSEIVKLTEERAKRGRIYL